MHLRYQLVTDLFDLQIDVLKFQSSSGFIIIICLWLLVILPREASIVDTEHMLLILMITYNTGITQASL